MSNKTLNIILYVTALIAVAVIIVFFIKLSNVEPNGKDGKENTDLVDADKLGDLSSLTGKQGTTPGPDGENTPSVTFLLIVANITCIFFLPIRLFKRKMW